MKVFHICTIANKLAQYEEMKSSFIKAGFDEERCRYSLFDNSKGNTYEPYSTFNSIGSTTPEPYIILCHQDILMDQGHGFTQLLKVLEELNQVAPDWAVAGNSGIGSNYERIVRITDPLGIQEWSGGFPQKVYSLDENFLVIKSSTEVACSSELNGFHFYGTDLCLNALLKGYSCHVIDFHLTHLSRGRISQDFLDSQARFQQRWNSKFSFRYVLTPCGSIFLSKYTILRYIFDQPKIKNMFLSNSSLRKLANASS